MLVEIIVKSLQEMKLHKSRRSHRRRSKSTSRRRRRSKSTSRRRSRRRSFAINPQLYITGKDEYLNFTQGFSQICHDNKFLTILGENHNDFRIPREMVERRREQWQYIKSVFSEYNLESILITEIVNAAGIPVPSYNFREALQMNQIEHVKADIRPEVLRLERFPGFYIDIKNAYFGNNILDNLEFEELAKVTSQILDFLKGVYDNSTVESFKQYISEKLTFLNEFRKANKKAGKRIQEIYWLQRIRTFSFKEALIELQMSVLEIYFLYQFYSLPKKYFVFQIGELHRRRIMVEYFQKYCLASILCDKVCDNNSNENNSNYVNLNGCVKIECMKTILEAK